MKILPKVYRGQVLYWRKNGYGEYHIVEIQSLFCVSRTKKGAIKQFESYIKRRGRKLKTSLDIIQESWLGNVLLLLVPGYNYNAKHKWETIR